MLPPIIVALAAAGALLAGPAQAQTDAEVYEQVERVQGDAEGFAEAFTALTEAMFHGDAEAVANLADYPLIVRANSHVYELLSPEDFVENFDDLVMGETQALIAAQELSGLIITSEGVGFGRGELWIASICNDERCAETHWAITVIQN